MIVVFVVKQHNTEVMPGLCSTLKAPNDEKLSRFLETSTVQTNCFCPKIYSLHCQKVNITFFWRKALQWPLGVELQTFWHNFSLGRTRNAPWHLAMSNHGLHVVGHT